MTDPKVVGGGVAVVAIGGGAGYGISQATSKGSDSDNQQNPSGKEITTIKQKIADYGFSVLPLDSKSTDADKANWNFWKEVAKKNAATVGQEDLKITELQTSCSSLLEKEFKDSKDSFKEAIKKCVKPVTFKDRATSLNLNPITQDSEDHNDWKTKWDGGTAWQSKVKDISELSITLTKENQQKLAEFCKKLWKQDQWTVNMDSAKYWETYLTACTNATSPSAVDFWKSTIPSLSN